MIPAETINTRRFQIGIFVVTFLAVGCADQSPDGSEPGYELGPPSIPAHVTFRAQRPLERYFGYAERELYLEEMRTQASGLEAEVASLTRIAASRNRKTMSDFHDRLAQLRIMSDRNVSELLLIASSNEKEWNGLQDRCRGQGVELRRSIDVERLALSYASDAEGGPHRHSVTLSPLYQGKR